MNSPFSDPTISLALAPLAPPAGGPGPGTPDEAMAMVKRAQGKFRMAGADATSVSYTHLTLPTNREV